MISNFLTTNIWLKLASIILAIALWFFVILSGRSEIIMDVPIVYINTPYKLKVVNAPKTVRVSIEGQERFLKNIKQNEIRAVVDLSKAKAGNSSLSLSKDNIKLPNKFIVTSITPKTISFTIKKQ